MEVLLSCLEFIAGKASEFRNKALIAALVAAKSILIRTQSGAMAHLSNFESSNMWQVSNQPTYE